MSEELTVEQALKELREMFPVKKRIELGASFSPINTKEITCRVQIGNTIFMSATMASCMAQVRKWKESQS